MAPKRLVTKPWATINQFVDWLERNDKWIYLGLIIASVIALASIVYGGAYFFQKYNALAKENRNRITDIQDERILNIYKGCRDTNERHSNAEKQVNKIYKNAFKNAETEADRIRLAASKASTLSLINALVPFRKDCEAYALSQVPSIIKEKSNGG